MLRRRWTQRDMQTMCLRLLSGQTMWPGFDFHHVCELQDRHAGWCLCWCGCAFTKDGVIDVQQRLDLGEENIPRATHVPK